MGIREVRKNKWEARLKKEKAMKLDDLHKKIHQEEQEQNGKKSAFRNNYNGGGGGGRDKYGNKRGNGGGRGGGDSIRRRNDRHYDDDEYYYEDDHYYQEKRSSNGKRKVNSGGGYGGNDSRYKPKHSPDKDRDHGTASKFGMYQKKATPQKQRRIVGRPTTMLKQIPVGGGGGGGVKDRLKRNIKEYLGH